MNGNSTNTLEWSRRAISIALVVGALVLAILVGLLLLGAAALGMFVFAGGAKQGPPSSALLVTIVVLLVAILILLVILLVLLRNSANAIPTSTLGQLLAMIPFVNQLPGGLRALATALRQTSNAVQWLSGNIRTTEAFFKGVGNHSIPVPSFETEEFLRIKVGDADVHTGLYYIKPKDGNANNPFIIQAQPLAPVQTFFSQAANQLEPYSARLSLVQTDLGLAANAMDAIADAVTP